MEDLTLIGLACTSVDDEPSQEEKQLINALIRSGLNQLTYLEM